MHAKTNELGCFIAIHYTICDGCVKEVWLCCGVATDVWGCECVGVVLPRWVWEEERGEAARGSLGGGLIGMVGMVQSSLTTCTVRSFSWLASREVTCISTSWREERRKKGLTDRQLEKVQRHAVLLVTKSAFGLIESST